MPPKGKIEAPLDRNNITIDITMTNNIPLCYRGE